MRPTYVGLGLFSLAALFVVACSHPSSDAAGVSEADVTPEDMAKTALKNLGAKVEGAEGNCIQCHDINKATLRHWATSYQATLAFLKDESKSADERINFMRRDPSDPRSGFAPSKLGFLTAGAHLGESGLVNPAKHPTAFAQGVLFAKLFAGRDDDYARFRNDARMPIEVQFDRLDAAQYESIVSWVEKGMPKLDDMLHEDARPTACTEDFSELSRYVRSARPETWAVVNKDNRMPMFACDASGDPLACFKQQSGGADIFPDSKSLAYAKTWAADGATVRVLRPLEYRTFFWMRASADGQFVSNGGGPRTDGANAVIADLGAALDPTGPKTRDIAAEASYDPDFSPRDDWFMFQGTARGGVMCALSLLRKPATTRVTFLEPECSKLDSIGLYQTVGQVVGDNSIGDSFVVNSKFASDNPGLTASDSDLELTAGPAAAVRVAVAIPKGNDPVDGYQVRQSITLGTPFKGDTMMARSGRLIGSRVAGENGMLGYAIDKVTFTKADDGYKFSLHEIGRICMPGNKANFSFDERFLVSHHYLTRADFASDAEWAPYRGKGASDIYLADMQTGTKKRITRMAPGQFAIYPHFRSDDWLYFLVRDGNTKKEYVSATDYVIRATQASP